MGIEEEEEEEEEEWNGNRRTKRTCATKVGIILIKSSKKRGARVEVVVVFLL